MIRGYHITYLDKLQSIMSRGLRIDADGWLAGYVWFWDDHDVAMGMTSMWGRRVKVLIQVDLTGLPVVRDPHREGNGPVYAEHAYATPENVEPSRLTVLAVINSEV